MRELRENNPTGRLMVQILGVAVINRRCQVGGHALEQLQ